MKNKYTPTAQKIIDHLKSEVELILTENNIDFIYNLKARWADEKMYEDFADYQKVIKAKTGHTISKGFKITIKKDHMTAVVSFNARAYSWKITGIRSTDVEN